MDIGEDVKYALRPFSVSSSLSDSNPNANDSASATPENLKALAAAAISVIVQRQSEESALSGAPIDGIEDINLIKRTYSALVCIYLEAACKDLSSQQFFSYLTAHCGLSDSASNPLCDLLAENKHELRKALSRTADHSYLRRLTGVEWKLDYCVSASDDKDFKELIYFLKLNTNTCDSAFEFACTVEQLQDLLAQLKDACKAVERGFSPH